MIDDAERKIYALTHEEAYGWSSLGVQVIHKNGDRVHTDWNWMERLLVSGGTMTHNHPRPSFPMHSWPDLVLFRACDLREMRVVSKDLFQYQTLCHRSIQKSVAQLPPYSLDLYVSVMAASLNRHKVHYTVDSTGVHPYEILRYSIDALDEGMQALGKYFGFSYAAWTSKP